jgi:hypothetical protein
MRCFDANVAEHEPAHLNHRQNFAVMLLTARAADRDALRPGLSHLALHFPAAFDDLAFVAHSYRRDEARVTLKQFWANRVLARFLNESANDSRRSQSPGRVFPPNRSGAFYIGTEYRLNM